MKLNKRKKILFILYTALVLTANLTMPVFAANDPVAVVNNFSEFMFGLIRAIGMILPINI